MKWFIQSLDYTTKANNHHQCLPLWEKNLNKMILYYDKTEHGYNLYWVNLHCVSQYFLSTQCTCSLAFILKDTMLEFLGSKSEILGQFPRTPGNPRYELLMELPGCEYGVANIGYDAMQLSGAIDVTLPDSEFFTDDVIQGSNGKGDPKATLDFLEIKPEGNSSLILSVVFSSLSWRLHFARRFWNHTF